MLFMGERANRPTSSTAGSIDPQSAGPDRLPTILIVAALVGAGIFFLDLRAPLGVAGAIPYIAVVVLGWWTPGWRYIAALAIIGAILTGLGYLLSPPGGIPWVVAANRVMALFAIAVTGLLLVFARRNQEASEESELLYGEMVENVASGVITIDDNARITSFNHAAEKIFGYARSEVLGENVRMLMPISEAVQHDTYVRSYLDTGEAKIIGMPREVEGLRKNGDKFPMLLGLSDNEFAGTQFFTGTVIDFTERKESEVALQNAKIEADQANQAKSDFLSSMSHELRTPLNAILGFSQVLVTDTANPLTDAQKEQIVTISQSGEHLLRLINEVLDLAKVESGKVSLEIVRQNPTSIVRQCAAIAANLAGQKGLQFVDQTENWSLPEIEVDSTRLRQVLLNLLSNAVKYNRPSGTVAMSVEAGPDSGLRFLVTDTGSGIPVDRQRDLFLPFSRLGMESSNIEGTGIGLSITKKLVDQMGGAVGFDSEVGSGSTFWLDFPIASGELSEKPAPTQAETSDASNGNSVLCVDDNPASLQLLAAIIDRIPGTAMVSAHTAELGINLAEIHQPKLILLDINLPGIDGFAALKKLKAMQSTKEIPVVALTAAATDSDRKKGLDLGFDQYLTKPIDVAKVSAAIGEAIGLADGAS
jgi:PAS domain S-box-containing protein